MNRTPVSEAWAVRVGDGWLHVSWDDWLVVSRHNRTLFPVRSTAVDRIRYGRLRGDMARLKLVRVRTFEVSR